MNLFPIIKAGTGTLEAGAQGRNCRSSKNNQNMRLRPLIHTRTLRKLGFRCFHPYILVLIVVISVLTTTYTTLFGSKSVTDHGVDMMKKAGKIWQRFVNDRHEWQLLQTNCEIPLVSPYSKAYMENQPPLSPKLSDCSSNQDVAFLQDDILTLQKVQDGEHCCGRMIERPVNDPNDSFTLGDCKPFQDGILNVSDMEFIRVECFNNASANEGKNNLLEQQRQLTASKRISFYANVPNMKKLMSKVKNWGGRSPDKVPASIFLLVIDSTSRTEAIRSLPLTIKFLKEVGFIDFKGHHSSGLQTLHNLLPLLLGMTLETFLEKYQKKWEDFWDPVPFLWKTFDNLNYVTGYFEDLPHFGTFNYYDQRGFVHQPVDVYTRPLMLAHAKVFNLTQQPICFGTKTVLKFFLDYHLQILKRLRKIPFFLVSWPTWPWHDYQSTLKLHDKDFVQFFRSVSTHTNAFENSWIIVISDHSFMRGKYYNDSHEGLLERRTLPLLIRPPNSVMKNPTGDIVNNLKWNSKILTGHFDVFSTVLELARTADPRKSMENMEAKVGQSLLSKLPANRTCSEAGIPKELCACNLPAPPGVDSEDKSQQQTNVDPSILINLKTFVRF